MHSLARSIGERVGDDGFDGVGNLSAIDDCVVIDNDPFGEGWLFEVEVSETGELMTADEYAAANGV